MTSHDAAPAAHREGDDLARWTVPWLLVLLACAFAAALTAGLAPLADPDLPIHMAVGEWIVQHRTVPYVEPFAWTRAGEPYYAYAWLWQTMYFLVLRDAGATGLHLLAGVSGATVVLTAAFAGRSMGLRPAGATVFAMLAGTIALASTPFLRPQLVMHSLVLLGWATAARIASDNRPTWGRLGALLLLGAISANTQITFPVLAAPLALLVTTERFDLRTFGAAAAALGLGFVLTPYAVTWPELVGRLSQGITAHHPPVGELRPGFAVSPVMGLGLASLPLFAMPRIGRTRERVVFGAMWLAGLLTFFTYYKGLGPWWWCAIPLCVIALARLPVPSTTRIEHAFGALLAATALASAIPSIRFFTVMKRYESDRPHGSLPSVKAYVAEPAVVWLQRNMRPEASGKLLTVFTYGSYLRWRLPSLSQSIDSRGGIFPDSAALPDVPLDQGSVALGPWRSSDLAIVPVAYPVAKVLDADPAWMKIGECEVPPWLTSTSRAALWVRRVWWIEAGRAGARPPADGKLSF